MKKLLLLPLVAFIMCLNSCDNTDGDDMRLIFQETKCANPWTALPDQGNYLVEVRSFLEENDIQVVTLGLETYGEDDASCEACTCLTGRNIVLTTPVRDVLKAEVIGFVIAQQ